VTTSSGAHPDAAHEWVSFVDDDGDTWMFDLTFLTSSWTCIYGRGCPGVLTGPTPELEQGCCSYGAHFADDDDVRRVEAHVARLTDDQWQLEAEARRRGGPLKRRGGETLSRLVDGACIFLNRPGFPGGAGCALHRAALEAGERPLDWKPDVCWQLPLRLVELTDEHDRTTFVLREWTRADWGDGGTSFHWWCTDAPHAFIGDRPVYRELRDEIVALVGEERYARLVDHVERHRRAEPLPHPAEQAVPGPIRRRREAG
jgi:hypothetical protein